MTPRQLGFVPLVLLLTAGATSPAEPPIYHTGVDLVALDLVVRDRKGDPIRDLRRDELEIYEDGVRQQAS